MADNLPTSADFMSLQPLPGENQDQYVARMQALKGSPPGDASAPPLPQTAAVSVGNGPPEPILTQPGGAPAPGGGAPAPNAAAFGQGTPAAAMPDQEFRQLLHTVFQRGQFEPRFVDMMLGLGAPNLKAERAKATVEALRKVQGSDHSARYGERGGGALAFGDALNNVVDAVKLNQAKGAQETAETELGEAKKAAGHDYFANAGKDAFPASQFQQPMPYPAGSIANDLKLDLSPDQLKMLSQLDLSKFGG
jgi:flagellar hook-basal body complex protein FliE